MFIWNDIVVHLDPEGLTDLMTEKGDIKVIFFIRKLIDKFGNLFGSDKIDLTHLYNKYASRLLFGQRFKIDRKNLINQTLIPSTKL